MAFTNKHTKSPEHLDQFVNPPTQAFLLTTLRFEAVYTQTDNKQKETFCLELLHGGDISGLDVVLELLDLLLELIERDLLILDNEVDLELLNTEANGNELAGTPDKAVLLNATDSSLHGDEISLIIWVKLVHAIL